MGFTLLRIPPDIIRTIIKVGVENIDTMRMVHNGIFIYIILEFIVKFVNWQISPVWNTMAVDHLNYQTHLPSIRNFTWSIIYGVNTLEFRVHKRFHNYFGFPRSSRGRNVIFSGLIPFDQYHCSVKLMFQVVEINWGEEVANSHEYLSRIFKRCSQIEFMNVDDVFYQENFTGLEVLKNSLKNTVIETFSIQTYANTPR